MIDNASAILSQGGGSAFSVKSRFIASLSSVKTPRSKISKASSIVSEKALKNKVLWSKYRGKSKKIDKEDDIFES
jgi:hypothetical protein